MTRGSRSASESAQGESYLGYVSSKRAYLLLTLKRQQNEWTKSTHHGSNLVFRPTTTIHGKMSDITKHWHTHTESKIPVLEGNKTLITRHPGQEFQKLYLQARHRTGSDGIVSLGPALLTEVLGTSSESTFALPSPLACPFLCPVQSYHLDQHGYPAVFLKEWIFE